MNEMCLISKQRVKKTTPYFAGVIFYKGVIYEIDVIKISPLSGLKLRKHRGASKIFYLQSRSRERLRG